LTYRLVGFGTTTSGLSDSIVIPAGIDAGRLLVDCDAGLEPLAATTLAFPRTDSSISATAGTTTFAGIA
jgi:hypothetical protein